MAKKLLRLHGVLERRGIGKVRHYKDIKLGRFTHPVKLGRLSAWPEDEVDVIITAQIAGKSGNEIRALVKELEKARSASA
jgi:prophage regulatory protein